MKKRWISLFLVLCLMLNCAACADRTQEREPEAGVGVYRLRADLAQQDGTLLEVEAVAPETDNPVAELLELFWQEPVRGDLQKVLPEGVRLLNWQEADGEVTVSLSEEFWNLSNYERAVAQYAITLTLCSLETVKTVSVYVGTEPCALGLTAEDAILTDLDTSPTEKKIKLYFPERDSRYMDYEYHTLTMDDGLPVQEVVAAELLRGPYDPTLETYIPAGTRLLSVVTEDGMCIVNLSGAFLKNIPETLVQQRLCIYSIVNTITTLSDTEQVMILVEGEQISAYGAVPLDEPLQRCDAVIGPVNPARGQLDTGIYLLSEETGVLEEIPVIVTATAEQQPEVLMETLLDYPHEPGFINLLSAADAPISVEMQYSICYVNFPDSFYVSRSAEQLQQTVGAVVRTLTGAGRVQAVQFLINGATPTQYADLGLDQALTAQMDFLFS